MNDPSKLSCSPPKIPSPALQRRIVSHVLRTVLQIPILYFIERVVLLIFYLFSNKAFITTEFRCFKILSVKTVCRQTSVIAYGGRCQHLGNLLSENIFLMYACSAVLKQKQWQVSHYLYHIYLSYKYFQRKFCIIIYQPFVNNKSYSYQ